MTGELLDTIHHTAVFLRMAAIQMRRIAASKEPGVAQQLRHMADQCEAQANELTGELRGRLTPD